MSWAWNKNQNTNRRNNTNFMSNSTWNTSNNMGNNMGNNTNNNNSNGFNWNFNSNTNKNTSWMNSNTSNTSNNMNMNWNSRNTNNNPNNDKMVSDPPKDSISEVRFSPNNELLAVAAWDNEIYCYQFDRNGETRLMSSQAHNKPVLCCCWDANNNNLFSGGCDCTVRMWSINNNQQSSSFNTLGTHDGPVRCIEYASNNFNILITGSWDKSIKYWDIRSGQNVGQIDVGSKVFCMAQSNNVLIVGLANKNYKAYDLRNPSNTWLTNDTPLKHQLRCLDIFPDGRGFAVASVEGRTAVIHLYATDNPNKNFSFKCHRHPRPSQGLGTHRKETQDVYGVNCIRFHQQFGTFASAGDDGQLNIWDKEGRSRLKHFLRMKLPITSVDFSCDGQIMCYSTSYNWNKGMQFYNPNQQKPRLYLHRLQQSEIDPKCIIKK